MLSTDPPDHHRLRRLVTKAFTARRIEQLRPRVAEITASLLDAMPTGGQVDLLEAFAFPLPITVIAVLAATTIVFTLAMDSIKLVVFAHLRID